MKKIVSLLLVVCFLLTALLACGEVETEAPTSGENKGTTTETDQFGQQKFISAVPVDDLDFNKESLTIIIRDDDKIKLEFGKPTPNPEDILDQAVTQRNERVASDLNLTLNYYYAASSDAGKCRTDFLKLIQDDVDSKLHEYDIAAHFGYYASDSGIRERSANLLDKDLFPYFDFSLPCWNQSVVKSSNINGKSIVCAGDLTLSIFNFAMVIWQNVDLYNELKNSDDPENMQDLVLDGEWTAGYLLQWANFFKDTDAKGDCDTYGVRIQGEQWCTNPTDAIPFAWKLNLMTTNNDGTHSFNFIGNDKAETAVELFRDIYKGDGNAFMHSYSAGGHTSTCHTENGCFVGGNIVFNADVICWDERGNEALRNMEDEYALLPWPKYDENQDDYYTTAQDCYTLIGVIDHWGSTPSTKGEAVSAYLQYSTELSYTDVRGMYFGKIVEPKFFGTDDTDGTVTKSIEIFNGIVDNLQFDYYALYSASLGHPMHIFRYCTAQTSNTLQAYFESQQAAAEKALKQTEQWFGLVPADGTT